ncbi:dihydrofolate reductase family protein [Maribellus maritimus]|uniref:dihydrofolate reductase family protein n=1 Tax=Maribellus maritimus TaxID=2870838 RepID=UPI001EEA8959|nr:dihydrofolate reductase family protein [Maribellus maritimus]MCG6186886.1 dihydrofolate reductase family protein [Maribellus maritimus]
MAKIKLYIAQSLNSKIALADGSVEWLESIPNPENTDHGYAEFFDSVGITIMGNSTYKQLISWDIEFPYKTKINYVFTRNPEIQNTKYVTFVKENHIEFVQNLRGKSKRDIWLIGGGQLNTWFLNEKLIDEVYVFIMPIVVQAGIELFEAIPRETRLELTYSKVYKSGVIELRYKIKR